MYNESYQDRNPLLLKLGIVFLILTFLLQGYRIVVANNAISYLNGIKSRVAIYKTKVESTDARLEAAKLKHLKVYLANYSLEKPKRQLAQAQSLIKKAESMSNPIKKRQIADQAIEKIKGMSLVAMSDDLDFLDLALANWQKEPEILLKQTTSTSKYLDSLVGGGYFAWHFTEARKLLDGAKKRYKTAIEVSGTPFEGKIPDYRRIYADCLTGEKYALDAQNLGKAVPELRKDNIRRANAIPGTIAKTRKSYESAYLAASHLEKYPNYRCQSVVLAIPNKLANQEIALQNANQSNSLEIQKFEEAARQLSTIEQSISNCQIVLTEAIDNWSQIQSAIVDIPEAKSSASDKITEAQSQIDAYSQNTQTEAEEYLDEARSNFSQANGCRNADPITSLSNYNSAHSKAEEAYNAVDTMDHSSSSSSSSDDGSSSSYGTSGGSSYDPSGSSSYDSGSSSYGGGSSGSFDSSPSGSFSSSPSGSSGDGL